MILFKDYHTGQKSITMSGVVATFFLVVTLFVLACFKKLEHAEILISLGLAFHGMYLGLYLEKKIRIGNGMLDLDGTTSCKDEECTHG